MQYKLKHHHERAGYAPAVGLRGAALELLKRLLGLPCGAEIEVNGEPEFISLELAGYLRLVTNRSWPSGRVNSRICYVSPSSRWPLPLSHGQDPGLFIGLPFYLPKTSVSSAWLAELDFVDPYVGDILEVKSLASSAPSQSARHWLNGLVAVREREHNLATIPN